MTASVPQPDPDAWTVEPSEVPDPTFDMRVHVDGRGADIRVARPMWRHIPRGDVLLRIELCNWGEAHPSRARQEAAKSILAHLNATYG
jgi:hypothetical protein